MTEDWVIELESKEVNRQEIDFDCASDDEIIDNAKNKCSLDLNKCFEELE